MKIFLECRYFEMSCKTGQIYIKLTVDIVLFSVLYTNPRAVVIILLHILSL